ncbi:MAG: DUF6531 domain-containing protein [Candidatus Methanogasteraceae archaeon]
MTRRPPTNETRTVLRTILSAGVLAVLMVLACTGTAAGATWVVDDDGGAGGIGAPFPYTDPEDPFDPPNSEARKDFVVFKPAYMPSDFLGEQIIIDTGAGVIEGGEKVFVRQWYEPEYPEPRGMVWTSQPTVYSADIVTEYTYMLLDSSNTPVAGISGDQHGTNFWLPIGSEFGGSGDQIGLDSFVVAPEQYHPEYAEMVELVEVGDFNGDDLKDINIATRDIISVEGRQSPIQFMDHAIEFVDLTATSPSDVYAVVNLYYLGNDDPEQIGTELHLEVGGPMVVAGRHGYQNPGTPSFEMPWYLRVTSVGMVNNQPSVSVEVGRLLHMGETFFADGAEYDIAMIYGPTADSFRYITIRNPIPTLADVELPVLMITKEHVGPSTELPMLPPVTKEHVPTGSTFGAPGSNVPFSDEPVNLATGKYFYQYQDIFIPGRGLPLTIMRSYNSMDAYSSPFGSGWTFNYNINSTLSH